MKEIRLWYTQPGPGNYTDKYFTQLLSRRFRITLDDKDPDYVISSCSRVASGNPTHFDYPRAVKIFYTGENIVPDFNLFDYGIGFHDIDFGDRYLRYPLWLFYLAAMQGERQMPADLEAAERRFCNFVYSNNKHSDPLRIELFQKLSQYKKVDSGGGCLNNMGSRVGDKLEFLREYKFTIAAENSLVDGYTTEKLIEPLMMGSVPVYLGNPALVRQGDFNPEAMILIDSENIDRAVQEVERLDNDDAAYLEKLRRPIFKDGVSIEEKLADYQEKLLDFFGNIFAQPLAGAYRTPRYGHNRPLAIKMKRIHRTADSWLFGKWHGLKEKF